MNKSFAFVGREHEITSLQIFYAQRRNVLIVGPRGIGKTALLRQLRQSLPLLVCEETSSLRRICDGLERELGWKPAETFETGLRKTVQWYLDNQAWVQDVMSGEYRNWVAKQYAA